MNVKPALLCSVWLHVVAYENVLSLTISAGVWSICILFCSLYVGKQCLFECRAGCDRVWTPAGATAKTLWLLHSHFTVSFFLIVLNIIIIIIYKIRAPAGKGFHYTSVDLLDVTDELFCIFNSWRWLSQYSRADCDMKIVCFAHQRGRKYMKHQKYLTEDWKSITVWLTHSFKFNSILVTITFLLVEISKNV